MPYIYPNVRNLDGEPKVGDFECVALIRHYTNAPSAASWHEGEKVLGNKKILPGTAIATFVNGRWPGLPKEIIPPFIWGRYPMGSM